jgi:glycosyltransferase involved in cell wall biosynthesis
VTEPIRVLELRCADGPGGGPEKTILLGAAQSDPAQLEVTVCYLRHQHDGDTTIRSRAEQLGLDYREIRQKGPFDPAVLGQVSRLVRERQIDIVHAHDYKTDLLALFLARRCHAIPIATAHGWTGQSLRERLLYYPADKKLLARYPIVVAVSSEIRTELIRRGVRAERIRVILNGIDHRVFRRNEGRAGAARARFGIEPGDVVIGSVGRLEPQKRYDLLLHAFASLRPSHPRLRLLIAGEGGQRSALVALADRLGLGDSCRLLGHCESICDFYHAIDVFAQSSDYEGTPNVVLEAMAMEAPVVATNVGGTAELLDGDCGLIVPPGKPDQLANQIARTLHETSETARRVAAARGRVEADLSFDSRQMRLESLYSRLMTSQKSELLLRI